MMMGTMRAESRDRLLVAAVWLIGLGTVFLLKDLARWDWPVAWPLFVILLGVGGAASSLLNRRWSAWGLWAIWWPVAVTVLGIVLLASTTGYLGVSLGELVDWWPVLVIGVGAWFLIGAVLIRPEPRGETLRLPLAGATDAEVRISFGGGELTVGQAEPGTLVSGRFDGGVTHRSSGPGRVELRPSVGSWPMWWDHPLRWQLGITGEVPVDLRLESGANRSRFDLSALRIRRLEVHTGASETFIRLPSYGITSVRAHAGVASLTFEVPEGVSATIHSKMALGSTNVDERRFPRSLGGWQSPGFETASDRVDIEAEGGLGSVKVI